MIGHFFANLFEDWIRNLSGGLGRRLRGCYYRKRLAHCGVGVDIATGVYFVTPSCIHLGDHVAIDKNVILLAGAADENPRIQQVQLPEFKGTKGHIHIGSHSHVGIGSVIQGHGGVHIEDYFTTSSYCNIYSLSNDYAACTFGTMNYTEHGHAYYIERPVQIGKNVWLGLHVDVISTNIGDDVFVKPQSVVYKPVPSNSVAAGNPAVFIKHRFEAKA